MTTIRFVSPHSAHLCDDAPARHPPQQGYKDGQSITGKEEEQVENQGWGTLSEHLFGGWHEEGDGALWSKMRWDESHRGERDTTLEVKWRVDIEYAR